MKYIAFSIGLVMLTFAAAGQSTETSQRLPIRTADPVPMPVQVVHVVPMQTSGGGKMTPKIAVNIPIRNSDGGGGSGAAGKGVAGVTGTAKATGAVSPTGGGSGTNGTTAKAPARPSLLSVTQAAAATH